MRWEDGAAAGMGADGPSITQPEVEGRMRIWGCVRTEGRHPLPGGRRESEGQLNKIGCPAALIF